MGDLHQPTASPSDVGLVEERVAALLTRAQREISDGLLPSCQLAMAKDGQLVLFEALGAADRSTRYVIFSSTKPFVAAVIWQLLAEGVVDVDARIADLIPEFGTNGKDVVTLDQVLLHTSGFPRAPLGAPAWAEREARRAAFARWRLNWEPGTRYEYHPTSAHWVLAEVIHAVTGEDHRDAVNRRIGQPLGLAGFRLGGAPSDFSDVAPMELSGEPMTSDEIMAVLGVPTLDRGEVTDEAIMRFKDPDVLAVGVPGAGGTASAADVVLFYQALLRDERGLWDAEILADATGVVRNTLTDPLWRVPANRTRGLIVAGDDGKSHMRGLGRTVGARAFGHNGAAGQLAWADPDSGISFCYLTNGNDQHLFRQHRRGTALSSLAAVCADPPDAG
jgi:CubicO group peptidase (beta-lactamase class C family)